MKAKYLLTAMAAAPLMFSCTQDDLLVQENGSNNEAALQERVKVGKVAFIGEKETPETRFDYVTGKWVDGDMFRLFLMDEWNGNSCGWGYQENGEEQNANKTHFMEQQIWNRMYSLNNRISTNIPFYYNSASGAWENDDAIVEGNYFAVAPATGGDQKALLNEVKNRRDVWVYINPVQKFDVKKNTAMTDGMDENQFFLGYTQVYRNEQMVTDDNVLQLPLQLRPILANIDMVITNHDELPFKVEKLVIKRNDGGVMPTLAYVRPCGNTPEDFYMRQDDNESYYKQQWNKKTVVNDENIAKFESRYPELCQGHNLVNPGWQENGSYQDFGPAFAQPYIVDSYKDECDQPVKDYYWTISSWTRSAARSVVTYSYPGEQGFIPYGCTGDYAKPAYEYVIDFTDEKGEGVILKTNEWINPYFTLPHNMYMRNYSFILYGQQYNPSRDRWEEGVIIPSSSDYDNPVVGGAENDGIFQLPDLDPSQETDYIEANIRFDDFKVTKMRKVQVTNSGDLMNHLESYFGKNGNFDVTKNEIFYVTTLGEFEVSQVLVDYVQNLYDAYGVTAGSKALIYFVESKGVNGEGRVIFPEGLTNDHAIDLFYFSKNTDIVNRGTQVIEKPIIYDYNQSAPTFYETLLKSLWYGDILNNGIDLYDKIEPFIADNLYGGIGHIINEGTLTIKKTIIDAAQLGDAIYNAEDATLNIETSAIVGGANETDLVTVHNDGTLNIEGSRIQGIINNSYIVNVNEGNTEVVQVYNNNQCVGCPTGNAQFNINAGAYFSCPIVENGSAFIIKSKGEINVNEGAEAYFSGTNNGVITVEGKLIPYFANQDAIVLTNAINGVIYVQVDGHLMYNNGASPSAPIINLGTIYVKDRAHVMINGGNGKEAGIIDVTDADHEYGYQARSDSDDQFFRYRLSGTAVTTAILKKIVSEQNIEKNPFILEAESGETTQGELDGINVWKIKVLKDAKLNIKGTWELKPVDYYYTGLGGSYEPLYVETGGLVSVENATTFTIDNSTMSEDIIVTIDGKMRGEDSSKILMTAATGEEGSSDVIVNGNGTFEFAGAFTNLQWTKGNIKEWINKY